MYGAISCTVLWLLRAPTWHIQLKARVRKQGLLSLLSEGFMVPMARLATPSPGMEVNCRAMVLSPSTFYHVGRLYQGFSQLLISFLICPQGTQCLGLSLREQRWAGTWTF